MNETVEDRAFQLLSCTMKNLYYLALVILLRFPQSSSILTRMACSVSGNGTCLEPFCFITPVNNTVNSANFGCKEITRPLNKIFIRQKFYFKLFNDFVPFDIFPEVEYCSFVKKKDRNSFFYAILKTLNRKVPGLVHRCPYQGQDLQIRNLTVGASDLALWITGEYKVVYTFYDDIDSKILRVSGQGVIKRN